jgi:carbamoyl-phosphate synthase small subunit
MVMKNYSPVASNYRSKETLDEFLKQHGIIAIHDVDTRAITKHIRDKGAMRAAICSDDTISNSELLKQVRASVVMSGLDLASTVSCKEKFKAPGSTSSKEKLFKVIAYDFGIKQNIINQLIAHGCEVEVVPANTPADYILKEDPDGVFLSNGPGDPAAVTYAIDTVKTLIEKFHKPIFGICLGHQILALACGAKTFKLKFGHRGSNQPIKNLDTTNIEIASHNHGFAVSKENLPANLEITHLNINDDTVAGLKLKNRNDIFSVQYHPEASPGPHDSDYLFKQFTELMKQSERT